MVEFVINVVINNNNKNFGMVTYRLRVEIIDLKN
jgi:hypothetical protein